MPWYAYVRVPLGGEKAQQYANQLSANRISRTRYMPTEWATDVLCEYGTNDLSLGLASMKTSILTIAGFYIGRGIRFTQTTLFPKTTSSDGWLTVTNQVKTSEEGARVAFNAWLRDTSVNGFVQQANVLFAEEGMVDVIDVCKYIEVNSDNELSIDGGYWRIPTSFNPISETITSVTSSTAFTDASKVLQRNEYKGYSIVFTSGSRRGKGGKIFWNDTSGQFNIGIANANIGAPAVGDSYQIVLRSVADGVHPTSQGHILGAQAVQERIHP